jgi:hypothetical protein
MQLLQYLLLLSLLHVTAGGRCVSTVTHQPSITIRIRFRGQQDCAALTPDIC